MNRNHLVGLCERQCARLNFQWPDLLGEFSYTLSCFIILSKFFVILNLRHNVVCGFISWDTVLLIHSHIELWQYHLKYNVVMTFYCYLGAGK